MIRIEGLKKAYGPKIILNNVTYHFPQGSRVALVGANGVGKTTLLNILCSLEEADAGDVIRPRATVLGYLPQEPNPKPAASVLEECVAGAAALQELRTQMESALASMTHRYTEDSHATFERAEKLFREAGGLALEARARGILAGLGFSKDMMESAPRSLSGGWRMRLELARIFVNSPDFLVLDEPTNHLDLPSLVWVEKYLQSFPGTLLFVSHDRALLNRLATFTLHLHRGNLTSYKGNFDAFLEEREARSLQEESTREQLRKRAEALETFISRFGAKATKAKQAQSKAKTLARIRDLENEAGSADDDNTDSMSFQLPTPPSSGREVFVIEAGAIGYGRPLSRGINLKIHRGQKVAIIGANGIGKSTLLKTIAGRLPELTGSFSAGHNVELAYFAQDQLEVLDDKTSVLLNVQRAATDLSEKQARSLLGQFLFRGDDVFKPVGVLSGGEKSRVGLACLLVQKANFLLLDEPTNHLDMSSAEILADALDAFEGTLLFVSHDRTFIDATCTHIFAMLADGRSQLFEGKLDDYERLAAVSGFPNVLESDASGTLSSLGSEGESGSASVDKKQAREQERRDSIAEKRERQRLERIKAKLDEDMSVLAQKIVANDAALHLEAETGVDFKRLRDLQVTLDALKSSLSATENEWLEVSERLDELSAPG